MQSKYTTKEIIEKYTNKDGDFVWGVETVIDSLKPDIEYNLNAYEGKYVLTKWEIRKPTSEEIKEEYIRQQVIAESIEYLKEKKLLNRIKNFFNIIQSKI